MKLIEKMPKGFGVYIKKPILIKAIQIDEPFQVKTLEGTFTAKAGDYLVEGVAEELYPCDKKIFERSYDELTQFKGEMKCQLHQ